MLAGSGFGGKTLEEMKCPPRQAPLTILLQSIFCRSSFSCWGRRYRTNPQLQAERAASPELSTLKPNPRNGLPDSNRNDVWWSADGREWHEVAPTPWLPRHANSVFVFDGSLWMGAQTPPPASLSLLCYLAVSFLLSPRS
eukprot:SAG11_NODE_488_length_8997_cov_12.304113_3_plen_140_part_00